jgi:hypothetical protein
MVPLKDTPMGQPRGLGLKTKLHFLRRAPAHIEDQVFR